MVFLKVLKFDVTRMLLTLVLEDERSEAIPADLVQIFVEEDVTFSS